MVMVNNTVATYLSGTCIRTCDSIVLFFFFFANSDVSGFVFLNWILIIMLIFLMTSLVRGVYIALALSYTVQYYVTCVVRGWPSRSQ